jgi:hypothetical protein
MKGRAETRGDGQDRVGRLLIRSEFAVALVEVDHGANGSRLMIEDCRSGACNYFDALELVSLVTARHEELDFLLDPARLFGETREHRPDARRAEIPTGLTVASDRSDDDE